MSGEGRDMTRRPAALGGALLILGLAIASSSGASIHGASCNGGPCALRLARATAARIGQVAGAFAGLGARNASAGQEVLKFKPVSPESASELESQRSGRPERSSDEEPAPGAAPLPPEPPRPEVAGRTGDIMRIGSDVHVERDQVVAGDLMAIGGDVTVDGHVEGDLVALGGDVDLHSTARVDGDVVCMGGQLREDPGAAVGGKRVTGAGLRSMRGFHGRAAREALRHMEGGAEAGAVRRSGHVAASLVWLFVLLGVAWGFAALAPGRTGAAAEVLERAPALSLGLAALVCALIVPSLIALCLVVAILCITIIGIPIAIAALFGYFVFLGLLWVWGYAVAMQAVGGWVLRRSRRAADVAMPGSAPPAHSLERRAVAGVLLVSGAGFAGEFLKMFWFAPPLPGIGTFISVVSIVASSLAAAMGGGAWLRSEFTTGTLGRWWRGRRPASEATVPNMPSPAPTPGMVAADPGPAAPPSSPPTQI